MLIVLREYNERKEGKDLRIGGEVLGVEGEPLHRLLVSDQPRGDSVLAHFHVPLVTVESVHSDLLALCTTPVCGQMGRDKSGRMGGG